MPNTPPRLAILGAGPIGMEAALAAAERGWPFTIYEREDGVAGHVRQWGHVRTFTPWAINVSERMRGALERAGTDVPDGPELPTGAELVERLYEPAAAAEPLAGHVATGTKVEAVGRDGLLKHDEIGTGRRSERPFRLLLSDDDGERVEHADVVIDATGSYSNPNALGDGGIPAPGERAMGDRIERFMPRLDDEPEAWAGRTVLLTGAGHSAQTAARDFAAFARHAPGTKVIWAVRAPQPDWAAVPNDPLPERAALNASAAALAGGASEAVDVLPGRVTEALSDRGGRIAVTLRNGAGEEIEVDRVLALNGGVGDFTLYRQLQVHECYATAAPMDLSAALLAAGGSAADCLTQPSTGPETLINPEPGFFMLGAKSYGRNSQFLLRIGWQQVDDVFGLLEAA
jgi:2-polyprenyl-6-methoxyphenol hydroxylase-like FAD-dependent oxidoreductase